MCANILITGASGYVGGSIITEIWSRKNDFAKDVQIHAAVRSQEQAESFSERDIRITQLDLSDKSAVVEYVLSNDIDLVINNATSIDPNVALNLISGLRAQREATDKESYYIHTTGLSAFDENTNWPFGEVKDTDPIYDLEKKSADTYIVRQVDTFVVQQLKAAGVTGFLIFPPTIHGRGSGTWNQLSPQIPALVKASVKYEQVYRFAENRKATLAHISDVAAFYAQLLEAILRGEQLPTGEDGYYFLVSHVVPWWDILDPRQDYILVVWSYRHQLKRGPPRRWWLNQWVFQLNSPIVCGILELSPKVLCEKKDLIGWKPVWNKESFLERLDEEIDDFLELGMPKSSLLDSLKPKSGN